MIPNGPLYTSEEIPKIHITIDPDSLETLYLEENWYENHEYPALFVFENSTGLDTIENIGLRFRGNTSRDKVKKSFKVSFNTYISGQKFHGVEKLNLNAEVNDPSMIRSRLYWDLCKDFNIVSSRSNHVELFINGDFMGLYQNIEHIDDEFVQTWFGSDVGNLYKCTLPADLVYISNDPDDYKLSAPWNNHRIYDLKTNKELDDYSGFADFVSFLNLSSEEDFACGFEDRFNINQFLKIAAIDVLTGHWDGYIYFRNNFYLYDNPLTGKFEYIPYDTDNTFGIVWFNEDFVTRDIYNWSHPSEPRPLFNRLMAIDKYRNIFSWHLNNVIESRMGTPDFENYVENLHEFITESALSDPYRPIDFGADEQDFLNALNSGFSWFISHGVLDFIEDRVNSAQNQLDLVDIAPIIAGTELNFANWPNELKISAVKDGPECMQAQLDYSLDGVQQEPVVLQGDQPIYEFTVEIPESNEQLDYNITFSNAQGLSRTAFCQPRQIIFHSSTSGLVLNELMSSNQSTVSDEFNEFDDWIEIYNGAPGEVNLNGYVLSDNNSSQTKWQFPNSSISEGSHHLIWADKEIEQGDWHANFRLQQSGESLYLFKHISDNILELVDYIHAPALPTDYSFGRENDGALMWVLFEDPTPDSPNGEPMSISELHDLEKDHPFPNPTTGALFLRSFTQFALFDISGRELKNGYSNTLELYDLTPGVYLLQTEAGNFKILKR
jgi:hypothetical protein